MFGKIKVVVKVVKGAVEHTKAKDMALWTAAGVAVGTGAAVVRVVGQLSFPVSFPLAGAALGHSLASAVSDKKEAKVIGVIAGVTSGALCIPLAPVIVPWNLLTVPFIPVAGGIVGAIIALDGGYKAHKVYLGEEARRTAKAREFFSNLETNEELQ